MQLSVGVYLKTLLDVNILAMLKIINSLRLCDCSS